MYHPLVSSIIWKLVANDWIDNCLAVGFSGELIKNLDFYCQVISFSHEETLNLLLSSKF